MPQDAMSAARPAAPNLATEAAGAAGAISRELMDRARTFGVALQRRKREHDFGLFRRRAASYFQTPPVDDRHDRMSARSGYAVATGDAEATARTVEIGYGARDVENLRDLQTERVRIEWPAVRENGAALLYTQGEDGCVRVFLYPARTDGFGPEEDAILLARYADLEPLTGEGALSRHWNALRAYAESTSLDGEPGWKDHLRVAWLRLTRPILRNGRVAPAEWPRVAGATTAVAVAVIVASLIVGA